MNRFRKYLFNSMNIKKHNSIPYCNYEEKITKFYESLDYQDNDNICIITLKFDRSDGIDESYFYKSLLELIQKKLLGYDWKDKKFQKLSICYEYDFSCEEYKKTYLPFYTVINIKSYKIEDLERLFSEYINYVNKKSFSFEIKSESHYCSFKGNGWESPWKNKIHVELFNKENIKNLLNKHDDECYWIRNFECDENAESVHFRRISEEEKEQYDAKVKEIDENEKFFEELFNIV